MFFNYIMKTFEPCTACNIISVYYKLFVCRIYKYLGPLEELNTIM